VRQNCAQRPLISACSTRRSGLNVRPWWPLRSLFWLRCCSQIVFRLPAGTRTSPGIRLGGASFQKIKQPLRNLPGLALNCSYFCASHKIP
jgi:hypothetical protein